MSDNNSYVLVPKSAVREDFGRGSTSSITSSNAGSVDSKSSARDEKLAFPPSTTLKSMPTGKTKLGSTTVRLISSWDPTLTTGTKMVAAKLDITGSSEFSALANLYDEFAIDSVTVTQVFDNSTIAQANAMGISGVAIDVNSDGSSPTAALTNLQMQHNYLVAWLDPKAQKLKVKFNGTNSASGQWPKWQKSSIASSFYPGAVYAATSGFPSTNTILHFLIEFFVSFRTRQ